jgi:hypothetical protein
MAMALGNNDPIRYDKIAECLRYKAMAVHNAFTGYHPAYVKYNELWNELNDSEIKLLVAVSPINNMSILQ